MIKVRNKSAKLGFLIVAICAFAAQAAPLRGPETWLGSDLDEVARVLEWRGAEGGCRKAV